MVFWLSGIVIMLSHFVEGITGFGCMILALPVVAALVGIRTAVPLLVILSTLFDLALVWRDRKYVNYKEAGKMVLFTSMTMPVGFLALRYLPEKFLGLLLGVCMIGVAIYGLYKGGRKTSGDEKKKNGKYQILFLPFAGLAQGAFGGSGPFMILYAQGVLKEKTIFRSTMAMVWVALNLVNLTQYQMAGMIDSVILKQAITMIPFLVIGFVTGVWMHKKISEKQFERFVYGILLVAGVAMTQ